MQIIGKVASALQRLFGPLAEEAAQSSGVIQRRRCFDALSLAKTFVLGFLGKPNASAEDLAQMAAQCGVPVTPQAVDQRQTPALVHFLKDLFVRGCQLVVGADKALAPLLERFHSVAVLDSTTVTLPDELANEYPGCGGSYGGGQAALKLQVEWDLRRGALTHVDIESGRTADGASQRQRATPPPGALRITDLGYFALAVFASIAAAGAYFLSRLQFGTQVLSPEGNRLELLRWLAEQPDTLVDRPVRLGVKERLSGRLIAWRLPVAQANRRRQKLREDLRRRKGKEPSVARLAWCDWTILVTNVPPHLLTAREALVLYRARWQVELLFKRWKGQDLVATLRGSTVVRQMVGVWSRLLAALVQHWLVVAGVWGDPTKSLRKASEAVRSLVGRLAASLDRRAELERVLTDLLALLAKTCRRNQRSKPGTFEMLNDIKLLDFKLN